LGDELLLTGALPLFGGVELTFPGELFGRPCSTFAGDLITSRPAAMFDFLELLLTVCDRLLGTCPLRLLLVKLLFLSGNDRGVLGALVSPSS